MERIVINAGCGPPGGDRLPALFGDWRQIRVDIDPEVIPDIVADITDLSMIDEGTADAFWTAHCLEHLFEHDIAVALGEIRRILKDDGFACIVVPDLQRIAARIVEDRMHDVIYVSASGPITAHDMVYGFGAAIARGQHSMAHRCGFTPAIITRHVVAAGFAGYAVLRRSNLELAAIVRKRDWTSQAERDHFLAALSL